MLARIDNLLNRVTMYRLALYYLIFLSCAALALSFLRVLPYSPVAFIVSVGFIVVVSWGINNVFAYAWESPTNVESLYITALILALIITPPQSSTYQEFFAFAFWATVWAMASKYLIAVKKKHLFNPAAFAVAFTSLTINQSASWWIGTISMMPFVLIGGLLIVRKLRRFDLVASFLACSIVTIMASGLFRGVHPLVSAWKALADSPLLFFAFIMITEPLTAPPTKISRVWYGTIVGFLFAPAVHIGRIYSTPELSLLFGNIFSYVVSPKEKLIAKLRQKTKIALGVYDFVFETNQPLQFHPGQYLEWTLKHQKPDSRGNRRYFTIASSPTEKDLRLGVKYYDQASSFKQSLLSLNNGDIIVASQRAGDFVLPKNQRKKIAFFAGGIGITPFRSMLVYLLDRNEPRDIVLFYSNKTADEIAYRDVLDRARKSLNISAFYVLTEKSPHAAELIGKKNLAGDNITEGRVTGELIKKTMPDYKERFCYISGPHGMVTSFEKVLKEIGVANNRIKKDFFPGFV